MENNGHAPSPDLRDPRVDPGNAQYDGANNQLSPLVTLKSQVTNVGKNANANLPVTPMSAYTSQTTSTASLSLSDQSDANTTGDLPTSSDPLDQADGQQGAGSDASPSVQGVDGDTTDSDAISAGARDPAAPASSDYPGNSSNGPDESIDGPDESIDGPDNSIDGPDNSIDGSDTSIDGPDTSINSPDDGDPSGISAGAENPISSAAAPEASGDSPVQPSADDVPSDQSDTEESQSSDSGIDSSLDDAPTSNSDSLIDDSDTSSNVSDGNDPDAAGISEGMDLPEDELPSTQESEDNASTSRYGEGRAAGGRSPYVPAAKTHGLRPVMDQPHRGISGPASPPRPQQPYTGQRGKPYLAPLARPRLVPMKQPESTHLKEPVCRERPLISTHRALLGPAHHPRHFARNEGTSWQKNSNEGACY